MEDLKVGDIIEFIDTEHVLVNGVKCKIVPVIDPITKLPSCMFVKDR